MSRHRLTGTCNPPYPQNCFQVVCPDSRAGTSPAQPSPALHSWEGPDPGSDSSPATLTRQSEATPLLQTERGAEGALCTWSQASSQHEKHNRPLSHLNKIPNLPTFQINAVYELHQLPVRSYYSNTKAETVSNHLLRGRTGSWEVCDQLGLGLSYPSNAAPADPAALPAHRERRACPRTRSLGRQVSAGHSLR